MVPVLVLVASAAMYLLRSVGLSRLVRLQVNVIHAHQRLADGHDVGDQTVQKVHRHGLADDHAQDLDLVLVGWKRVV
jgi:hypothetical protein